LQSVLLCSTALLATFAVAQDPCATGRFPEIDPDINQAEDEALDNSIYATFTKIDLSALQEGRRRMIEGVSNESVEGYLEVSRILLNLINVLDLYTEWRIH
jgi:hypothetical protein